MAWTDIKDDGVRREGNELLTYDSALTLIEELRSESKFYELEPAEDLFVYTNPFHQNFPLLSSGDPDLSFLGAVRARFIYSEQGELIDNCHDFKPLNSNIYTVPVIGELIVGVNYGAEKDSESYFYISTINYDGIVSNNDRFGASVGQSRDTDFSETGFILPEPGKQGDYFDNKGISKTIPFEGDTVIDGRFGNSIRLGSNQVNEPEEDSSLIHLTAGRTNVVEDIDNDKSTILLADNTPLEYSQAFIPQVGNFSDKSESEILINSNRIILNSKNNGNIGILSSGNISIGARGETVIESPDNGNIKFGGEDATEPGVLGEELKKVLDILLKAEIQKNTVLIGVNTVTATAKTAAGDAPGAAKLVKQNVELQKLNSEMVQVIAVGPYLSKIVKTK